MREEKLELLQTGIAHIAQLWEAGGHQKWSWIYPSVVTLEREFDALSLAELRRRLRGIYRRLQREKRLLHLSRN